MDRSYLSDQAVVAASRRFVCARLATYEDADEAAFLTGVFRPRSGTLENSTFAILAPDGERLLTRAGRSPHMVFRDAAAMAATMERLADEHDAARATLDAAQRTAARSPTQLPWLANLRLALNVTACDAQRLLVVVADDDDARGRLAASLAPHAWSDDLIGHLLYVAATAAEARALIPDLPAAATRGGGFAIVEPDAFGQQARCLAFAPRDADDETLLATLTDTARDNPKGSTDAAAHRRSGRRDGVRWETAIPVTDPHERRARGSSADGDQALPPPPPRGRGDGPRGRGPRGPGSGGRRRRR